MKLDTFTRRHQFCITPIDVMRDIRRSGRTPNKVNIVCNNMRDGYCIHELKDAINDGFIDDVKPTVIIIDGKAISPAEARLERMARQI